jgi:hypothetical protein
MIGGGRVNSGRLNRAIVMLLALVAALGVPKAHPLPVAVLSKAAPVAGIACL